MPIFIGKLIAGSFGISFPLFINRIEEVITDYLGLPKDYNEYKKILEHRYSSINKELLTSKTKSFLNRVLAPSKSKREFYEKIGLVVFDRKIETIKDREEALFLSNLKHLFGELERNTAFNFVDREVDEVAYNIELATSKGDYKPNQTFRLPKAKIKEAEGMETKLEALLSGNNELNVCVLLNLLNKRMK